MDVRLGNGDVYLNAEGKTEYLCAADEAAQRALIAASVTKGSFRYDRSLGADYAAVGDTAMLTEKLDMLIREAAAGVGGAEVTVTGFDAERGIASLRVTHAGETITTEVDIHGNL